MIEKNENSFIRRCLYVSSAGDKFWEEHHRTGEQLRWHRLDGPAAIHTDIDAGLAFQEWWFDDKCQSEINE